MNIYIFKSELFPTERRKVISNFPLDVKKLTDIVNEDNSYVDDVGIRRRWYLVDAPEQYFKIGYLVGRG